MEPTERKLPPVWVMGLANMTFGFAGGFCAVTIPNMLAAQHVPVARIATAAGLIMSPGFWTFLLAPLLDIRFRRRTYSLVFGVLTALAIGITVAWHPSALTVGILMMPGFAFAMLYQGAVGGWMGSLIGKKDDGPLGMWFAVTNMAAGGLMMVLATDVMQWLPPVAAGLAIGAAVLLPMAVFPFIPAPLPDSELARERFGRFLREAALLVRQRKVRNVLIMFTLPVASFGLTNILAGMGHDFATGERTVGLLAGVGSVAAGIVGSFLLHPLSRRFALRPLYLSIGIVGAAFTLSLLLLPRVPFAFGIAITGQSMFQALSFATAFAIGFEVMGPNNPFAATLYSLFVAAANLPITYMEFVDGWGYHLHGLAGSFITDAACSVTACSLVAWFLFLRKAPLATTEAQTTEAD